MKRIIGLMVVTAIGLVACGGNGEHLPMSSGTVQFVAMTKSAMLAPVVASAPVEVNALNIVDSEDDDPHAFDDLLMSLM